MGIEKYIWILAAGLFSLAGVQAWAADPASDDVSFRYRSSKTEIEPAVRPNADNLTKLDQILSGPRAASIKRIELRASSSPNGSTYLNKKLAHERAQGVMDFVSSKYPSVPASVWQVVEVAEDWDGVESYLLRSRKAYKDEALQIVRGGAANREELLQDLYTGEAWDDLVKYCFPYLRTVKLHIVYEGDAATTQESGTQAPPDFSRPDWGGEPGGQPMQLVSNALYFERGSRVIKDSYMQNVSHWEKIRSGLADLGSDSVLVEAYASPEGTISGNNALTQRRVDAVKEMLSKKLGVPASQITVRAMGEDWRGLRDNVAASYQGRDRDEVLRILDSSLSEEVKKSALRRLDGGRTWQHLLDNEMKTLRRVTVRRFSDREEVRWSPREGLQVFLLPDLQSTSDQLNTRAPQLSLNDAPSGLLPRSESASAPIRQTSRKFRF